MSEHYSFNFWFAFLSFPYVYHLFSVLINVLILLYFFSCVPTLFFLIIFTASCLYNPSPSSTSSSTERTGTQALVIGCCVQRLCWNALPLCWLPHDLENRSLGLDATSLCAWVCAVTEPGAKCQLQRGRAHRRSALVTRCTARSLWL
jgi:hypothetical protein